MRNTVYAPWIFATVSVFIMLLYTLNKHDKVVKELEHVNMVLLKIDSSNQRPAHVDHGHDGVPLKGAFEESRNILNVKKDFKPDSYQQHKNEDFDHKAKLQTLIDQNVPADNPELINIIRNYYIQQPSTQPYNLLNPERVEFSQGQSPFVDSRLKYMEGGFYVECGALNGEKGSNSLFFEKVRKWNGLLIEGDPSNYAELKKKNRKAFSVNACISPTSSPMKVKFNKAFNMGRAIHNKEAEQWMRMVRMKADYVDMECFPLYSFMLALNRTTIDFFSLDVEGDEYNVLKTIPYDKLDIKMLTVEYAHGGAGGRDIQRFLEGKGYEIMLKVSKDDWGVNDLIFRKRGLTH